MSKNLIRSVKNGNADIAEKIVTENYESIYKYCYWKIGNCEEAQDITQEVFLRFMKNIDTYSDQGKPKAFLYTIAKNLCINWSKKHKVDCLDTATEILDLSASEMINQIPDKILLENLVKKLPIEQQEVIVLRYGHELKINEIAVIVGTSRFTVRYRIKLALSALKNKLSRSDFVEKEPRRQLT